MPDINQGKPWSRQDDDDLLLEVSTGETVDHAATFLCRPPDEVMIRAAELRLQWSGATLRAGADATQLSIALQLVFQLEHVEYQIKDAGN
jgi:hypothetical protein